MLARCRRSYIAAIHDTFVAGLSFVLALYMRLAENLFDTAGDYLYEGALGFAAMFFFISYAFSLQRTVWRYVSIRELIIIAKVAIISLVLFYLSMFFYNRLEGLPRSVPVIQALLLMAMLCGSRVLYRGIREKSLSLNGGNSAANANAIPIILVGFRGNAEQFLKAVQASPDTAYRVVAIADADETQHGRVIHGVPILGAPEHFPRMIEKLTERGLAPQRVILSEDYVDSDHINNLLQHCQEHGLVLGRLPRLTDFRTGEADSIQLRDIAVEDLLGRPQNTHDREGMRQLIEGKIVLITGAGGTIGGELSRQVASFQPTKIILLDSSEYNLYMIDQELGNKAASLEKVPLIADIRDAEHIDRIFATYTPDIVFHAAAIKHVPLAEANREAAIETNVFGTQNIVNAANENKTETMVMISTDKAVNPTNVMGACKRLAESYCQAYAQEPTTTTKYVTVRFGNVLGSTGSVVPLFRRQLKAGGPITVTHPDMERYFMTVREAVELVIQSAVLGQDIPENGLIFVLDMGTPVKIKHLAQQIIRLAGLEEDKDIRIVYTGLRPGEKLYEELFHTAESLQKTDHKSIMLAAPRSGDLQTIISTGDKIRAACRKRDAHTAVTLLRELVPEYTPES